MMLGVEQTMGEKQKETLTFVISRATYPLGRNILHT